MKMKFFQKYPWTLFAIAAYLLVNSIFKLTAVIVSGIALYAVVIVLCGVGGFAYYQKAREKKNIEE